MDEHRHGIAAVLSALCPGLGHIYLRQKVGPFIMLVNALLYYWTINAIVASADAYNHPKGYLLLCLLIAVLWFYCIFSTMKYETTSVPFVSGAPDNPLPKDFLERR